MPTRGEEMQEAVLLILRSNGGAMSAYDLLGELRKECPKMGPPTVYRALASLVDRKLVHRLETLNAFVACRHERHHDQPYETTVLSVCDDCGAVDERVAPGVTAALSSVTDSSGFAASRQVVELRGVCAECNGAADPS